MLSLMTDSPALAGELAEEIRLFIDERRIETVSAIPGEGMCIAHSSEETDGFYSRAVLFCEGAEKSSAEVHIPARAENETQFKKLKKRAAKQAVYDCLKEYFGREMPWGSLTGIRPTKLMRTLAGELGGDGAAEVFRGDFFVSGEKTALAREICAAQSGIIDSVSEKDIDIYIGIPFCTTRCAYCSFSSGVTSKDGGAEKRYVDSLLKEAKLASQMLKKYNVRCVYIGGGTPTALPERELARVLGMAAELARGAREFTVEAGRPDTMTESKLALIKNAGADRISVNAQTTCDETLRLIGRRHTAGEFFDAFARARSMGFGLINTDMITGLPGENSDTVRRTLNDVIALGAENITVHTLAIKHGSAFAEANARAFVSADEAERIVTGAREQLARAGYIPYYLYRQKYMTGNLENVGYCLPGRQCVYNIDIMEETASILALGAGGISKRVFPAENRIERAPNVKDILNYVGRTEEMAERKLKLFTE